MLLLCYLAVTTVAASMLMEDGQGMLHDPVRAIVVAFVAGMAAVSVPMMIEIGLGTFWTDVAFCAIAGVSAIVIALYVASARYMAMVDRRRIAEEIEKDAAARKARAADPVAFASTWTPQLRQATADAVAGIARFMERTADTYDDAAIDARVLAGHVPEIVRLAGEAIAKQDDACRASTARAAIDRVIAIGRAVEKASAQLRTPEHEALEARLRYVDVQVEDRFSAIA